ncbi:methyl-accepting chemotaxis protein, partial [Desulfonatronovibrio hydrogenovorans]|uniref:methyl-accepting chemotaxis protein n=1 Tax=Desulfonatronovibrio hydrogenovorans TaxID=53245 RepID=UPI00054D1A5F
MRLSIFWKILTMVGGTVLLVSAAIFLTTNYFVTRNLDQDSLDRLENYRVAFDLELEEVESFMNSIGSLVSANPDVKTALEQGDRDFLGSIGQEIINSTDVEFISFTDAQGNVLARGHIDRAGDNIRNQYVVQQALQGRSVSGVESGEHLSLSIRSGHPVGDRDNIAGSLVLGANFSSHAFVDQIRDKLGVEATIFEGDTRLSTTIRRDGQRVVGTSMENQQVIQTVLEQGGVFVDRSPILGDMYDTIYWPIIDAQGDQAGMFFLGQPRTVIEGTQSEVLSSILVVSVLIGGLMILAGYFFSRALSRPITKATVFATSVARGDFDQELSLKNKDELGVLSEALNTLVGNLKAKIEEAESESSQAQQESERARVATDQARQAKDQAEKAKREGMLDAASQLEEIVSRVSSASEELSAQVEQSSRGAEEQKSRTTETATAMEQMNATILEVAQNSSSAASGADKARDEAKEGARIVDDSIKSIARVQEMSRSVKNSLDELGSQATQIDRIMDVIEDIADQTNLLALNAAIEAARAGDAGRGFAVVADEVRKLAEKTMNATQEVDQVIASIQNGAKANIDGMDRAVAAVDEAISLADNSGDALKKIVELVEDVADQVRNIATGTEEQSSASEQVN